MRKLSKNEMKAVSGGDGCPSGWYFSTATYSCAPNPYVPPAPTTPTPTVNYCPKSVWIIDYNNHTGSWQTVLYPC